MSIDFELLETKIDEIDAKLEEIKALNETLDEFIQDVHNTNEKNINQYRINELSDRAYRMIFFNCMVNDKAKEIQNDLRKLIPMPATNKLN